MLPSARNQVHRIRSKSVAMKFAMRSTPIVLISLVAYLVLAMFAVSDSVKSKSAGKLDVGGSGRGSTGGLTLQNRRRLNAEYTGDRLLVQSLGSGKARPLALTYDDFDEDGAPDLVTGYENGNEGILTLQRGNIDAFAPKDLSVYDRAARGQLPPSFLDRAESLSVPERTDFLLAGDFDADGHKDLLSAARDGGLYLLAGNGRGGFDLPRKLSLPGPVSALTAGAFGHSRGWLAVIAAVAGPQGPMLAIFDQNAKGLSHAPTLCSLPAKASALALGLLDEDPYFDLGVAAGNEIIIVHGQKPAQPISDGESINLQDRIERVSVSFNVRGLVTGRFLPDLDGRAELAALGDDGTIRILQRTSIEKLPTLSGPVVDTSLSPYEVRNAIRIRVREELKAAAATPMWQPGANNQWAISQQLEGAIASSDPNAPHLFSASRISARPTDDLVFLDRQNKQMRILVDGTSAQTMSIAEAAPSSTQMPTSLGVDSATVAVVSMPQKINGERDLMVLNAARPTADIVPLVSVSLTVNTASDLDRSPAAPGNQCNGVPGDCSLREAVLKANVNTGPNTIFVPGNLGIYNLSINNPNTPTTTGTIALPDLQIGSALNTNTTVMGISGTPHINQTIANNDVITTGFFDGSTPQGVTLSLQNLEVTGGSFTGIFTGVDNATGTANTTIVNSNIHNNTNGDATFGQGGAIFNQCGTLSILNSTFSNNTATNLNTAQGGAIYYNLVNPSGLCSTGNFTVTNTAFTANTANVKAGFPAGGAMFLAIVSAGTASSITNSVFTGNQATGGGDGGAIAVSHGSRTQNILSSTFINNAATNASGHGGAIDANSGTVNVTFNRFIGNNSTTPANGKALFRNGGTVTVDDNWWGINTGPAVNDVVGAVTLTKWLQLRNTASPAAVLLGGATTLTASFLTNSANQATPASNLFPLAGLPVTWNNAQHGTLSNLQTSIRAVVTIAASPTGATESGTTVTITTTTPHGFSPGQTVTISGVGEPSYNGSFPIVATPTTTTFTYTNTIAGLAASGGGSATVPFGTATATFTAGVTSAACGSGGADATVDSQTTTASVTVQCPDLTVVKSNNVGNNVVVGQTWTWTLAVANSGDAAANFSIGQTVLADNLPNSVDINYTLLTSSIILGGGSSGTVSCSINGNKDLICTANGAVVVAPLGTFNVQLTAVANVVGIYANPRVAGISQVDPGNVVVESNEGNNTSSNSVTVNKASTTTTIANAAALNTTPSVTGEAVTVQWSVTVNAPGSVGAPLSGNVTVSDGTNSCSAAVSVGQCSVTFTTAGAKSFTAQYAGDTNYNGSTSAAATHTVNKADTTTTITNAAALNATPSVTGEAVTVQWSVAVNLPGTVGAPLSGNVTVSDGTNSCSAAVSVGQCSITFTTAGAKSLTAQYAGDTNYNGSTSAAATHTVNKADTTTTITNAAALNATPSVTGEAVTVQWSVAVNLPGTMGAALSENVTVSDGTNSCSAAVNVGQCSITFTTAGAKSFTAQYAGDTNYNGSTSAAATHTVNKADTTTTITNAAALNTTPSVTGEAVTVQWSVAVNLPGTVGAALSGNVTVSDGTNSCSAAVSAGQCGITFTTAGAKSFTAQYAGDTNYNGSTSAAATHTVNKADTTTAIISDAPDPSIVGHLITVNYSVVPMLPATGTPTGNVTVTVSGGSETCTGTVAAGGCSLTLTVPGARTITATYAGDTDFNGSFGTDLHTVTVDMTAHDAVATEPQLGSVPMLFTVSLSGSPSSTVTVHYATADDVGGVHPATSGVDYTATSGDLTFNAGEQVKTVVVDILADAASPEFDETLLLDLSAPVGANIADGQAVGTITQIIQPGSFLISELRTSGPGGTLPMPSPESAKKVRGRVSATLVAGGDAFIEFYNNADSPITVAASDASSGWGIFKMGADCNATPILIGTIPNGTVIPARGHFLLVDSAYSLGALAAGDQTMAVDLEPDRNVGIFSTADIGNISSLNLLDAAGFGANVGGNCELLREGTNLPALNGSTLEYSFQRDSCGKGGQASAPGFCPTATPVDTKNNSANFLFADTLGSITIAGQRLGAPGPENLASPLLRNSTFFTTLLDPLAATADAPNRVRDFTSDAINNSTFGTLSIRRAFTNNTGAPVTRLRFRIIEITSLPPAGATIADLRARNSGMITVTLTGGGTATVEGTTVETPPTQPLGGGFGSAMAAGTITPGTPLMPGDTINLQFLLGVQQTGIFRFFVNIEALP
jgi:hypothetical protein